MFQNAAFAQRIFSERDRLYPIAYSARIYPLGYKQTRRPVTERRVALAGPGFPPSLSAVTGTASFSAKRPSEG